MSKKFINPIIEIYTISEKEEVIVTSAASPKTTNGLGWFVLPQEDFKD